MKKILVTAMLVFTSVALYAQENSQALGILRNARYVYVTSYDGSQWDMNLLSEDRVAISTVQDAIRRSGKYALVYEPRNADMIIAVTSRGSEDVLAVYDARRPSSYLWRVMGRGGLDKVEAPFMKKFLDQMAKFGK